MFIIKQATLLLLNDNEEVFKRIPPQKMTELYETQELRAAFQIQGTILAQDYMKDFEKAQYVAVSIIDSQEYHVFALNSWKLSNDHKITFSGIDEPHYELDADGFIQDRRFKMNDFSKVIQPIFEGSRWTIRSIPQDQIPVGTINFYFESRLAALKQVLEQFDVDVAFSYEISGNKIKNRYVDFYTEQGRDTGKRFAYGSNALSIIKETATTDLYTAIVPRGDGLQKFDENGQATGGYSRKINIKDIEWKKSDGHPVDKPKGQYYIEIPERTAVFGLPNGHPKVLIKDYDGIKETDALIRQAYLDLLDISRPKIQFSTQIINLGNASLGDAVTIVMPKYKIQYKTRIFKLKIDLLTNTRSVAEFGDYVVKTAGQRAYEAWLKSKRNQDNQDEINAGINDVIDTNKKEQDKWNEGQENWNEVQNDWNEQQNKINETIKKKQDEIAKDIEDTRKEIGDYIKGQDQLGEIIFTGKDMLPTRGNIYNIIARSLINGQQGELIFNSNGLGWYGADGTVKMGITNDGRVIADSIRSNLIEGLTIKGGTIDGGRIVGAQFESVSNNQFMVANNSALVFGQGNDKSNPFTMINGYGIDYYDNVGGSGGSTNAQKGSLIASINQLIGQNLNGHVLGNSIGIMAAADHIFSLGATERTGMGSGRFNAFITISGGGGALSAGRSNTGYDNRGVYIEDATNFYLEDHRNHNAYLIASAYDTGLVLNKKYVIMDDLGD